MKRCPECRRDYYDDSLLYCLDDGTALLEGPAATVEPATAILSEAGAAATGFRSEAAKTSGHIIATDQTAILPTGAMAEPRESLVDLSEGERLSPDRAVEPQAKGSSGQRLVAVVGIAVIILAGAFLGYRYFRPALIERVNSIAVLPFENRSGTADTDYLSDGLADSLIYRLSQLPDLKVSPTSSVMRYRSTEKDVAEIATELDVDAVMSGRLVQRGDDLSISVQLIDSRTKKLIWAEQYDRKMTDLLATQREIATSITQKLELKLAGSETKGITKKYTDSNEAYQLYMRGRYHFSKRTRDDVLTSIDYYQQAIKLDPNFALSYARIAEAYNQMPVYAFLSPNEAAPQAKAAANRALEIDPTLAEAHTAMANALAVYDWNWGEAERSFKRAIELDPNSSAAHLRYGLMLSPVGRADDAIGEFKRAIEIEPLDHVAGVALDYSYFVKRQYDLALEQALKNYQLEPNLVLVRWGLARAYIGKGMYDEAIALTAESLRSNPESQLMLHMNGYSYARLGRRKEAEDVINTFRTLAATGYGIAYHVATIHAALGDKDKAFAELERSFQQRDWSLHQMNVDPFIDPLRDDPRFAAMVRRLNLPG